ncbi:MAG: tRNA (adenosine(37)-N6)-dimethylallyltransferase MiaA [Lachnospiraceae bacterium]|nr:tRNA (adenosine(37)-N6)-dimethylallyltransferase MiaA [Lachnospiraceae bacterium]
MKKLIVLTGPTAVGKTAASIGLAKAINGEIISADSMQVYKKMDIGTAKITKEEMEGVSHFLIDELNPDEEFSVAHFKKYADKYINEVYERGHIPIIVGGTGFYIQAVLNDIDFTETNADTEYRKELEELARVNGPEYLHNMLFEIDPQAAEKIHFNNVKRVIRALEFYKETGTKISEHNDTQSAKSSPYNFAYFVLNDDREALYERIDKRIDIMLENGLIEEVKALLDAGYDRKLTSMQGLGYKEITAYLEGEISLEEAIYILKRDTRHFAKRQLTWFRREKDVIFIDKSEYNGCDGILNKMLDVLEEKNIWRKDKNV